MEFLVTKASRNTWYEFKTFNSLEELIDYKNSCREDIIISKNFNYKDPINVIMYVYDTTLEDAKKIRETEYEIQIHDDYLY
jgi:gamma-glutamylcyclotransferase (GGCT)/AIG2-like uncharacterized protein YtfP